MNTSCHLPLVSQPEVSKNPVYISGKEFTKEARGILHLQLIAVES